MPDQRSNVGRARGQQSQPTEHHLTSPLREEDIRDLRAGDLVYLSGLVHTARDGVYRHMLVDGHKPPIDLGKECNVSFQSSPAGVQVAPGQYHIASFQATAGFRYAQYMPKLLEEHGIKAVVGKAGMSEKVYKDVFRRNGAVYLSTVGYGLGAIYGRGVKRVHAVYWDDVLGIAEALWIIELKDLGPLLVEGDVQGNSYFSSVNEDINRNLGELYRGLKEPIFRRLGESASPQQEMF